MVHHKQRHRKFCIIAVSPLYQTVQSLSVDRVNRVPFCEWLAAVQGSASTSICIISRTHGVPQTKALKFCIIAVSPLYQTVQPLSVDHVNRVRFCEWLAAVQGSASTSICIISRMHGVPQTKASKILYYCGFSPLSKSTTLVGRSCKPSTIL